MSKITLIDTNEARNIIRLRTRRGLFLCREGVSWMAVDNSAGDAWAEDFRTRTEAEEYLMTCA